MLIFMAVDAQELPVAAIGRVVVVVAVLMMDGQFAQPLAPELPRAAPADPRQDLQRLIAVRASPLFRHETIYSKPCRFSRCSKASSPTASCRSWTAPRFRWKAASASASSAATAQVNLRCSA